MEVIIHLYFILGKLLYSFLGRRDRLFVLVEIIGSVVLIAFTIGVFPSFHSVFLNFVKPNVNQNARFWAQVDYLACFLLGSLYFLSELVSRLLIKNDPVEVNKKPHGKSVTSIGIVDFSWIAMISTTYAGLLFCQKCSVICDPVPLSAHIEFYGMYFDELEFLLDHVINMTLVLGSILAACMAIIWTGELWRKNDQQSRVSYRLTTSAAIQMVTAYFVIMIAVVSWIALPIYLKMTSIKSILNSAI